MIEIKIFKNNIQTNGAKFETQELADAWLNQEIAKNSFGKNERWVTQDQEDISNALESRIIEFFPAQPAILDENSNIIQEAIPAVTKTEYRLAADYIIEQVDISTQVEQERINQEALAYLASTDWMVIRAIESGVSVPTEITTARAAARLSIIR